MSSRSARHLGRFSARYALVRSACSFCLIRAACSRLSATLRWRLHSIAVSSGCRPHWRSADSIQAGQPCSGRQSSILSATYPARAFSPTSMSCIMSPLSSWRAQPFDWPRFWVYKSTPFQASEESSNGRGLILYSAMRAWFAHVYRVLCESFPSNKDVFTVLPGCAYGVVVSAYFAGPGAHIRMVGPRLAVIRPTGRCWSFARKLMPADSPLEVGPAAVVGNRQTVVVVPCVRVPHDRQPHPSWCAARRCVRRRGFPYDQKRSLVASRL